jgi:hypothetical protein
MSSGEKQRTCEQIDFRLALDTLLHSPIARISDFAQSKLQIKTITLDISPTAPDLIDYRFTEPTWMNVLCERPLWSSSTG